MSKKVAPRIQLNFAPEEEEILPDEELESPQEQDLPCEMPEVIERDEIVENDIFDAKPNQQQTDIVIEEAEPETPPPSPKQVKRKQPKVISDKPKVISDKPQKKKRQLSEEHKAKLALAREKENERD